MLPTVLLTVSTRQHCYCGSRNWGGVCAPEVRGKTNNSSSNVEQTWQKHLLPPWRSTRDRAAYVLLSAVAYRPRSEDTVMGSGISAVDKDETPVSRRPTFI